MSQAYKYRITMTLFAPAPVMASDFASMVCGPVLVDRVTMTLIRAAHVTDPHLTESAYRADTSADEFARFRHLDLEDYE